MARRVGGFRCRLHTGLGAMGAWPLLRRTPIFVYDLSRRKLLLRCFQNKSTVIGKALERPARKMPDRPVNSIICAIYWRDQQVPRWFDPARQGLLQSSCGV